MRAADRGIVAGRLLRSLDRSPLAGRAGSRGARSANNVANFGRAATATDLWQLEAARPK